MKPCSKRKILMPTILFLAIFVFCLLPLPGQAISPFPPAYGIYLQKGDEWTRIDYQRAYRTPLGEMGYVMGVMHQSRVFLLGERAKVRISDRKPFIYFFGANPAEFYSLVRLQGNGIREFHYSTYGAGDSLHVMEEYLVRVETEKVDKDLYRMTPVQELAPGEYGIVLGESICAFGVDK
jgi:hypothetical protein